MRFATGLRPGGAKAHPAARTPLRALSGGNASPRTHAPCVRTDCTAPRAPSLDTVLIRAMLG
jgi:hypothetical protein